MAQYNSKGSCVFQCAHYAITIGHYSIQLGVWGAVSPPAASGRGLVGVQGAKPPEALRILYFTVPEKGLKTRLQTLLYHGEILPVL